MDFSLVIHLLKKLDVGFSCVPHILEFIGSLLGLFLLSCKSVGSGSDPSVIAGWEFFLGSGVYTSFCRHVMFCLIFVILVVIIHQGFIIHIKMVTCQAFHSFLIYQLEHLCNKLCLLFPSPTFPRRQLVAISVQQRGSGQT